MKQSVLGTFLSSIVSATLAQGCGGSDFPVTADEFTANACTGPLLTGLQLATPVDYLAFRFPPNRGQELATTEFFGVECKGATQREACLTALATAAKSSGEGWMLRNGSYSSVGLSYLVATVGDEVRVIANTGDLVALFGPIDTLEEARVVAKLYGVPTCSMRVVADGYEAFLEQGPDCSGRGRYHLAIRRDASVELLAYQQIEAPTCVDGRRPEGLHAAEGAACISETGRVLAEMAHLEAASVIAFEQFALDLAAHGAPLELVARARAAANDERRHAQTMEGLARAFGAKPKALRVTPVMPRTLETIAMENAVEGCVRETYGALLATWQAETAGDVRVARAMRDIAGDERLHAELSWDAAAWFEEVLDGASMARIRSAMKSAVRELEREVRREVAPELVSTLGFPNAATAPKLLHDLFA